jgi:hypothetical protein
LNLNLEIRMTTANRQRNGTQKLSEEQAAKLRGAIAERTAGAIARECGVADGTIARAASEQALYSNPLNAISRWLATH